MAACSPSDLLNANPFLEVDAGLMKAIELELLRQWAGSTETPSQILDRACASGFGCIQPELVDALEAQLLCNISSA